MQGQITAEEKQWATLAHASIALGLVTLGILGPAVAFIIWLAKRSDSDYVNYQALQAFVYQIVVIALSWGLAVLLTLPLLLLPFLRLFVDSRSMMPSLPVLLPFVGVLLTIVAFFLLFQIVTVVYGCYGAFACSRGQDFRYYVINHLVPSGGTG